MSIPSFSVKRPVTITMIFSAIMLLGLISWFKIPQDLFPSISYPQLTVATTYENASPEEIETMITGIIEEGVGILPGIKSVESVSKEGISLIFIKFHWGVDMNFAALNAREKIDLIKRRLPDEADEPLVLKFNPFELPVVIASISSDMSQSELDDTVRNIIKPALEKVEGVASVDMSGGISKEVLVETKPTRLSAKNISILDVINSLENTNLNYPAGSVEGDEFEYNLRTIGKFETIEDITDSIILKQDKIDYEDNGKKIKEKKSQLIKIADVADVKFGLKDRTSYSRYNGKENIAISIQRQSDANIIKLSKKIQSKLTYLKDILPEHVKIKVIYDQSSFISSSIKGMAASAVMGGILAFFVLLVFLHNVTSSLIIALCIPISVMFTIMLIFFKGISLNIMSLGGLALGIGMIVDNGIVVIENIFSIQNTGDRKQNKKEEITINNKQYTNSNKQKNLKSSVYSLGSFKESIVKGTEQVNGAITSSTLTSIAVFFPMIFVGGLAGQLFNDFAFSVTFSLVTSLIVAVSFIPRMALIQKVGTEKGEVKSIKKTKKNKDWLRSNTITSYFLLLSSHLKYENLLDKFLKHKWLSLFIIFILFVLSVIGSLSREKLMMPKVDMKQFSVNVTLPVGTKINKTNEKIKKIEDTLLNFQEVDNINLLIGSNKDKDMSASIQMLESHQARIIVDLKKIDKPSYEIMEVIEKKVKGLKLKDTEVEFILQESQFSFMSAFYAPLTLLVSGKDIDVIETIALEISDNIKNISGVVEVKTDIIAPTPEQKIFINKDKASIYNLSTYDISRVLKASIGGSVAGVWKKDGREYDIRVKNQSYNKKEYLENTVIHAEGKDIPLKEVVTLSDSKAQAQIKHSDNKRTISIMVHKKGRKTKEIMTDIKEIIAMMSILEGVHIEEGKEAGETAESFNQLFLALILSIILVYMIIASQFESLLQPFIILLTVPLAFIGVYVGLAMFDFPMSMMVLLGLIMLSGIVVNNGIVLIDRINQLLETEKDIKRAAFLGCKGRIRPILMTAMTTIFGLIPLAIGGGSGAEMARPMAITVIFGLLVSTLLTLFVVPALFLMFPKKDSNSRH